MITWIYNCCVTALRGHPPIKLTCRLSTAKSVARPLGRLATALEDTRAYTPATARRTSSSSVPRRPLRIIQWVDSTDSAQPGAHRMVMSGRFSDICAELERLAALESA